MFNVQLCVVGKAAELFLCEFHTGVYSSSCKPIDLRFMVILQIHYQIALAALMGVLLLCTDKVCDYPLIGTLAIDVTVNL